MYKRILFIFLLLLTCTRAFSTVFVVTSNTDSGPGTLRDALTQAAANGSATQDFINFNLPDLSLAGRTINLLSQLPNVSSNLVIDGTTQPGAKFGVSDAKVKITNKYVNLIDLNTFYSDGGDLIEIYGLWLFGDMTGWGGSAFHFLNFGTVKIGAPTKGNVIEWGNIGIETGNVFYFQNNICWTDPTGEIPKDGDIGIVGCDNVTIGGSPAASNTFAGSVNLFFTNKVKSTFEISYNKLGTDITGTRAPYGFDIERTRLNIDGPIGDNGQAEYLPVSGIVKNNIIADVYDNVLLLISDLGGKIIIQGNAFNTDFSGTLNFNTYSHGIASAAIAFTGTTDMIVGGDDPGQKNLIAYCSIGINYTPQNNFLITKNSIFCVGDPPTLITRDNSPFVKIKTVSFSSITGTATPNAAVELFNADCSCYNVPAPKDYFQTVKADVSGNWSYAGNVSGYVMASATLDNLTGSFTGLNVDDSKVQIVNSNCASKGSISGIVTQYTSGFQWFNDQNQIVGTDLNLTNVPAGKYTLKINAGTICSLSKSYEILDNSIQVDASKVKVIYPACNNQGSISGFTVLSAGNQPINYKWVDGNGVTQCDCLDLSNVNPGIYTFIVSHDDGTCTQTFGPYDMTDPNIIALDESKAQVTLASCSLDNGSITGMQIAGNAQYKWVDANNKIVATTVDLHNAATGDYTFTAYNLSGCSQTSNSYHVGVIPPTQYPVYSNTITASCFNTNNGSINITTDALVKSMRWVSSQGVTVGNTADLSNIAAGIYGLYLTDQNGCETFYNNFTVDEISPIQILQSSAQVVNDQCTLHSGSITGIEVAGGQLPYNYTWTDASGTVITSTPDITGLSAGSFTLTVKDARGCNLASNRYTIQNIENVLSAPSVDNVSICSAGEAFLIVNNPAAGYTYRLYDNESNATPTDSQPTGKFKINAQSNTKYYVNVANGSCESPRTEVNVTVGISGVNIPNTITPNGDGINDYWNIRGLQDYTQSLVQIFTRYGQKVFESKGYAHPFDGTFGGKPLPPGVYYYIINLNTNCSLFSGNLTIIR